MDATSSSGQGSTFVHIATRIRNLMRAKRPDPWRQEELAAAAGVSQSTVSDVLVMGDEYQSPVVIRALADALGANQHPIEGC